MTFASSPVKMFLVLVNVCEELRKAHLVIEVQGKVPGLLGVSLGGGKFS